QARAPRAPPGAGSSRRRRADGRPRADGRRPGPGPDRPWTAYARRRRARAGGARVSRRDNADARCPRCRVHASLCVCALIPRIETRTHLVLVVHRREERKPTNTGRLAIECLPNSRAIVRGHESSPTEPFAWDGSTQPLLLFPHADAIPIARFVASE